MYKQSHLDDGGVEEKVVVCGRPTNPNLVANYTAVMSMCLTSFFFFRELCHLQ